MSALRHLYRIGYNDNKGHFLKATILAESEGEAIKKFREHYGISPEVELSIRIEAESIEDMIA